MVGNNITSPGQTHPHPTPCLGQECQEGWEPGKSGKLADSGYIQACFVQRIGETRRCLGRQLCWRRNLGSKWDFHPARDLVHWRELPGQGGPWSQWMQLFKLSSWVSEKSLIKNPVCQGMGSNKRAKMFLCLGQHKTVFGKDHSEGRELGGEDY